MISFLFLTVPDRFVLSRHIAPSRGLFSISDLFNKIPEEENKSGTSSLYPSTLKLNTLCGHPIKLRGSYEGLVTHKEPNAFKCTILVTVSDYGFPNGSHNHDLEQMAKPQATESTEFSAIPRG